MEALRARWQVTSDLRWMIDRNLPTKVVRLIEQIAWLSPNGRELLDSTSISGVALGIQSLREQDARDHRHGGACNAFVPLLQWQGSHSLFLFGAYMHPLLADPILAMYAPDLSGELACLGTDPHAAMAAFICGGESCSALAAGTECAEAVTTSLAARHRFWSRRGSRFACQSSAMRPGVTCFGWYSLQHPWGALHLFSGGASVPAYLASKSGHLWSLGDRTGAIAALERIPDALRQQILCFRYMASVATECVDTRRLEVGDCRFTNFDVSSTDKAWSAPIWDTATRHAPADSGSKLLDRADEALHALDLSRAWCLATYVDRAMIHPKIAGWPEGCSTREMQERASRLQHETLLRSHWRDVFEDFAPSYDD